MTKPFLSVILPAYNEEARILPSLRRRHEYLEKQNYDYELIVVNDGSTDRTRKIVEQAIRDWPRFKLIDNKINKGKGGVVKQGMLAAQGEWRLFMDVDESVPINEIERFWPHIKNYEVIIGSRYIEGGKITKKQPLLRRIISRGGNLLTQTFVAWGIKDTQCGFKMFTEHAAKEIFPLQTMERWSFDMELIAIAKKHGYKIKEVPVIWEEEAGSKVQAAKAALRSLRDVFVIWWRKITGKYNKK
ncbi:MAG: putative glycosyltransferase [Candidatus Berkelbacteria bacterium Licking1014_96]|uniref:dolichyl-phosphate beta-glucosyltransferase n=1 Tax=Candidatus Berkelbacteria bacterium Licking1014_96 TaxID=2017149 RepID=A0A554LH52_9BACT|nr:MAG: putative glycosyltransferase [Candidatus Berkelbacteria bacterium Licking1014_96]